MVQITNLTSDSYQIKTISLGDGTTVQLTFQYRAAVQRWTVDVQYKTFICNGIGMTTHPNLLRTWRNVLPFGLQITTVDGTDPFMADDLSSERVKVYLLDNTAGNTDIQTVEAENFQ